MFTQFYFRDLYFSSKSLKSEHMGKETFETLCIFLQCCWARVVFCLLEQYITENTLFYIAICILVPTKFCVQCTELILSVCFKSTSIKIEDEWKFCTNVNTVNQ